MKTLNIYAALIFSIFAINISFAQTTLNKETIKVWGNCGMCKSTIEKSAISAGATIADWNMETKTLGVSYHPSTTNVIKIQKAISAAGYETQDVKADIIAYNKLHGCCKYDRSSLTVNLNCCANEKGCCDKTKADMTCCKDGKCEKNSCKDMPECKAVYCSKS